MKKRVVNKQKVFWLISGAFLLTCVIFYGYRFISLYIDNYTSDDSTVVLLSENILTNRVKDLNRKGDSYYFNKDTNNNYVRYSNLIWRIIKLSNDNIVLVSDKSLTSVAWGENKNYQDSYIFKWLNQGESSYSGVLENNLNSVNNYLIKSNICIDSFDEVDKTACNDSYEDKNIGLLSMNDYINTGAHEGFLNNGDNFYLANTNDNGKIWYVTDEGKVSLSDGTDIIGVRAVITIKNTCEYLSGDGSYDNPYIIDKDNGLFGSYVKLDNDMWRIYKIEDNIVKLVLNSYLKVNGEDFKYKYSNTGYYHNDTKTDTIAYYLNNTFLNNLSYKNYIKEINWSNGVLSSEVTYDYEKVLSTVVPTKVSLISLGDIILNSDLDNYFTSTGVNKSGLLVYSIEKGAKVYGRTSTTALKVVPAISLDKSLLTKGEGTIDSPYEIE